MKKYSFVMLVLSIALFIPTAVHAATSVGHPGTITQSSFGDRVTWTLTNAASDLSANDGSYFQLNTASAPGCSWGGPDSAETEVVTFDNFGFDLPDSATIDGIEISMRRYIEGTFALLDDQNLVILKAGVDGEDKEPSNSWPTSEELRTFGGSSDLWGDSWTVADIEHADFGFTLTAAGSDACTYIDEVFITVHYTEPPAVTILGPHNSVEGPLCQGYDIYPWDGESASLPMTFTVNLNWDQTVTGFTTDDVSVTNSTKGSFSGSTDSYSLQLTTNQNPVQPVQVTVAANAINEGNNAEKSYTFNISTDFHFCDGIVYPSSIYWKLDETSGLVADDAMQEGSEGSSTDQDGTVDGATGGYATWAQPAATTRTHNAGSLLLDGVDDRIYRDEDFPSNNLDETFYVNVWAQSISANPTNETIIQLNDDDAVSGGNNKVTIAYRSDTTNYLHVSHKYDGTTSIKRSNTSFDITDWNHILVKVSASGIDAIYVNGTEVSTTTSETAPDGSGNDYIIAGAAHNGTSYENFFNGYIDEVRFQNDLESSFTDSSFTTLMAGSAQSSCYYITALPSGISAKLPNNSDADPTLVGNKVCGNNTVRFYDTADNVPVADAPMIFTSDRDLTSGADLVVDTNVTDTDNIPSTPKAVTSFHANHGQSGAKTLYVAKGTTSVFRVCPDATDLSGVNSSCSNGVTFASGETKSVTFPTGANNVTVSTESIDSVLYWKATGVLGSGGQGEGEGEVAVPDLPFWGVLFLLLACSWVLMQHGFSLDGLTDD